MVFLRYNFVVLKRTVCIQALSILFKKNDNSQFTDSKLGVNIFATMRIIDFSFRRCCC